MNTVEAGCSVTGEELMHHHQKATGRSTPSLTVAIGLGKAADIVVMGTIAIVEEGIHGFEGGYIRGDRDFRLC